MRSELAVATSAHRALRDWPAGRLTPRLDRLVTRTFRSVGAICSCPGGTGS